MDEEEDNRMEMEAPNEDGNALRDIAGLRAESSRKNEKTALNHFRTYMQTENVIGREEDYNNVTEEKVTPELLGKFADYLYRIIEKRDGALQYVSKVKTFLCSKFPDFKDAVGRNGYYTNLRSNLKKLYLKRCVENNTQVRNTQSSMSDYDHKYIVRKLMIENTVESNEQRTFMNLCWVLLGRVEEVTTSGWTYLNWDTSSRMDCLTTPVDRQKVGHTQECRIFVHRHDFFRCALHALGCHAALVQSSDEGQALFAKLRDSSGSKYINNLLHNLYDCWENTEEEDENGELDFHRLNSHSVRRGATNHIATNAQVPLAATVIRGGWDYSSLQKVFYYIMGTSISDGISGRALSGWDDDPSAGGKCPGNEF